MPRVAPLSSEACARFRLAALIGDSRSVRSGADLSLINQVGDGVQDSALLAHVRRLVDGAGEHQLVMDRHSLALEGHDLEGFGIIDEGEAALGRDQFGDVAGVLLGVRGREDEGRRADPEVGNLRRERLRMVDHVMGSEPTNPVLGLRPRRGRYHGQVGPLAGDLDGDGADPACAADDKNSGRRAGNGLGHVQPVEQGLPGRQGRERERRRLGPIQRRGLTTDDAFVDEMQLGVRARANDRARVEDVVARLEQRGIGTGGDDDARGVPSQDLPVVAFRRRAAADLVVDRVDRHGPHLDQQVAPRRHGIRKIDVDERRISRDRARRPVSDGFHEGLQNWFELTLRSLHRAHRPIFYSKLT